MRAAERKKEKTQPKTSHSYCWCSCVGNLVCAEVHIGKTSPARANGANSMRLTSFSVEWRMESYSGLMHSGAEHRAVLWEAPGVQIMLLLWTYLGQRCLCNVEIIMPPLPCNYKGWSGMSAAPGCLLHMGLPYSLLPAVLFKNTCAHWVKNIPMWRSSVMGSGVAGYIDSERKVEMSVKVHKSFLKVLRNKKGI